MGTLTGHAVIGGVTYAPTTAITLPAVSTWPNASNTGPVGALTNNGAGSVVVGSGQVIQNQNFTGVTIIVPAGVSGWVIKNCRIKIAGFWGIDNAGSGTIQDCEFIGTSAVAAAIADGGAGGNQILRCNIHGTQDGIKAGQNSAIRDCYIHDLGATADSHNDAIQFQDYNNITVDHCWLDTPDTSCIIMGGGESRPACVNIRVTNNHFQGGAYPLYGPSGGSVTNPPSRNVVVTGNHWSTAVHPQGGIFGSNTQWEDGVGNVWSGNVWDDGARAGQPVTPEYG